MIKFVNIKEAVEITKNRVNIFKGQRQYLSTGELKGDIINEIVMVDFETKPSRADLLVNEGDIVVARMNDTTKVLLIDKSNKNLIVSTGFLTLSSKKGFDSKFLSQYFCSQVFQIQKNKYCSGATQKAINNSSFEKLTVPYYPVVEQKKIASILDQADVLRKKRQKSIKLLDEFLKSMFLEMFGDPVRNEKGWDCQPFINFFTKPLFNGTSPSSNGKIEKKVLTLTSITGNKFLENAFKIAYFVEKTFENNFVDKEFFLICRGNGNLNLVGKAKYSLNSMNDIVFPDTMIAASINYKLLDKNYLDFFWDTLFVRRQIEKAARTTNGTYKINQTMIESINILQPPINIQLKFSKIVENVDQQKRKLCESYAELDILFNALTQRYFG